MATIRTERRRRPLPHRLLLAVGLLSPGLAAHGQAVWINEIDYESVGGDAGEFVEIVAESGLATSRVTLTLYDGDTGNRYGTHRLDTFTVGAVSGDFTIYSKPVSGIQNGDPDGLAVDVDGFIVEFLSYEGTFTASDGPAAGRTSTLMGFDAGFGDAGSVGQSLQRFGTGNRGGDFFWTGPVTDSPGQANNGQTFAPLLDTRPQVISTDPADGAADVPTGAAFTVTFDEFVAATADAVTLACDGPVSFGGLPVAAPGAPVLTITPDGDLPESASCTLRVISTEILDQDGDPESPLADTVVNFDTAGPVGGPCGAAATRVHAVQGSGAATPLTPGTRVTVEGVVVGDYQGAEFLGGFFVQEEDADADGLAETSEGLFIHDPGTFLDVAEGDVVRVTGDVAERFAMTALENLANVQRCASGGSVSAATVSLPRLAEDDFERVEGMRVTFPQTLTVSDVFGFVRFGRLTLSDGRLLQPTSIAAPGADALAQAAANDLNQVFLDDQRDGDYQDPDYLGFSAVTPVRNGHTITGLTGVMDFDFGAYRVRPVGTPAFSDVFDVPLVNERGTPPEVGGTLTVASFNVLNYFATRQAGACGFTPGGRGAASDAELERQADKLAAAIAALDADVVGLIEIENNGEASLSCLVEAVNAVAGAGTYEQVDTGVIDGESGADAIRVALIYKPATVARAGDFAVLGTDAFVDPNATGLLLNRPALGQTFTELASGERFNVVVNHLKSKGFCPVGGPDEDQGDGQGCWNDTRTRAAAALADWLASGVFSDPDTLLLGDLNAYAQEDPVTTLLGAGYTDLLAREIGPDAYSFVFSGEAGYLDHALANARLLAQVTGAATWAINADEAPQLDYTTGNLPDGGPPKPAAYYEADAFRASDHDPVIVGLDLASLPDELFRSGFEADEAFPRR